MNASNLFILTGAPGTGKTAIVAELGRGIRSLQERSSRSSDPWLAPSVEKRVAFVRGFIDQRESP